MIAGLLLTAAVTFAAPTQACDDTLVMLLTAKNPASEFSKAIRSFTTSLTNLGSALKNRQKDSYDLEMNQVMDSWLEFAQKYMTSPPEEARNDLNWVKKTSDTARYIGEIRKLVSNGQFTEAHDRVLDLSGRIGMFFDAFGVSDEKQLFIKTSTNLTNLERLLLNSDYIGAASITAELRGNLTGFAPMLPASFSSALDKTGNLISDIEAGINSKLSSTDLDTRFQELKVSFEALRSHILMLEWFPALNQQKQEN